MDRPTAPLITIGITCFNASATIGRAIASATAQDWPALEVLVVDDCSTDGSVPLVLESLRGVATARLIQHSRNLGPAAARNTLLNAAQGEFIVFFDDDDVSAPKRVGVQHRALRAYEAEVCPPAVLCFASGSREYPNGYRLLADAVGSRGRPPIGVEIVDYLLLNERRPDVFYGAGTPTCALMARTQTLREVGGFDINLRRVEDVDMAIRLGFQGAHFIGCPDRLYLQYATVAPDKTPTRNVEAELAVIEKQRDYLEQRGLYSYARNWFLFRHKYFTRAYPDALWQLLRIFVRHPKRTAKHLMASGPRRLRHERSMKAPTRSQS